MTNCIEVKHPWPVGTKLRYWLGGRMDRYRKVMVVRYTKTGLVRVQFEVDGSIRTVASKSLSVI